MRSIVHPSDFSPASRPAFVKAVVLARSGRAPLLIAHVLPPVPMMDGYTAASTWEAVFAGQRALARRQLARLVARARSTGVRASPLLIDVGPAAAQIVRVAKRQRAEMIVMGTHGRTGLKAAILGSVAQRVVATARCPVMTVHGK